MFFSHTAGAWGWVSVMWCVKAGNKVSTTIHYKATDTHNYLEYTSSHPTHCRNAIPFSQFLRLRRICSDDGDYDIKSAEMASFFEYRGYPKNLIATSRQRAKGISRERALRKSNGEQRTQRSGKVPLVLNFHPRNQEVKKILLANFRILSEDPNTAHIFNNQPLCVHRWETNLCDILVHSTFASCPEQDQAPPGTFPCNRPRCRTCNYTAKTDTITSTGGSVHLRKRFYCTATGVVYAILCQQCHMLTLGKLAVNLQTVLVSTFGLWRDTIIIPAIMEEVFPWPSILIWPITTTSKTWKCRWSSRWTVVLHPDKEKKEGLSSNFKRLPPAAWT